MYTNDFTEDNCYTPGTFRMGDKIYSYCIVDCCRTVPNNCVVCDNKRKIEIKGLLFPCPQCKGYNTRSETYKRAEVRGPYTIGSVFTAKIKRGNEIVELERYLCSGLNIIKGGAIYSTNKAELEQMAAKFNNSIKEE